MNGFPLLTILTLVPFVGAIIVAGLGDSNKKLARKLALGVSFVSLALVAGRYGHNFDSASGAFQFGPAIQLDSESWESNTASAWMGWGC